MKKNIGITLIWLTIFAAIIGVYSFEHDAPNANIKSIDDAFWYGIVTLTTVGYGDFYPVTTMGRILGLVVILGSISLIGFLFGELLGKINNYLEHLKNGKMGTKFENHYIIIGWNDFARQVVEQIIPTGHKVAIVVNSSNSLEQIHLLYPRKDVFAMLADTKNMEMLNKVNIHQSKAVFVNMEDDTQTLVFSINAKKVFPNINITVCCGSPDLVEALHNSGIHNVISESEVASKLVASFLFEQHVAQYTNDLLETSKDSTDQDIVEFKVKANNPYVNSKYFDTFVDLKRQYNSILIGLVCDHVIDKNPKNDYLIKENDYLILIVQGEDKTKLETLFQVKEGH